MMEEGAMELDFGIPTLREDRLATVAPSSVYTGPPVVDAARTLFIWRSASLGRAEGMTLGFFRWDVVFQAVLSDPERYARVFVQHGMRAVCELDCSMWRDTPIKEQIQSVRLARSIGRRWQELGLRV